MIAAVAALTWQHVNSLVVAQTLRFETVDGNLTADDVQQQALHRPCRSQKKHQTGTGNLILQVCFSNLALRCCKLLHWFGIAVKGSMGLPQGLGQGSLMVPQGLQDIPQDLQGMQYNTNPQDVQVTIRWVLLCNLYIAVAAIAPKDAW